MLVNATAMLQSAEKGHYGIGAFNTNNLEWASSILDAGEELQSPLIIQCTSGAAKWQTSFKLVADMVKDLVEAKNITVPVALHLDHGSYEAALECIDAGFTSVMYDGSHEKDFETNLAHTAEIVKLAHNKGISVEAEVGGIGGTEDGVTAKGELADPEQCKAIAAETGATISFEEVPAKAAKGADVLYTDVWVSMGEPVEVWAERINDLAAYQINQNLMNIAGPKAVFMHCLPAYHDHKTTVGKEMGERFGRDAMEVTDEVFEGPQSIVFDEAENRMHTIKAVMAATLGYEG